MLNTSGHVLVISTKDDKFAKYTVPASRVAWGLSIATALLAAFRQNNAYHCC